MVAKLAVTVVGVMWGLKADVINSPFVFSLSYLFFLIVVSYGYFKLREFQMAMVEKRAVVLESQTVEPKQGKESKPAMTSQAA